MRDTNFEASAFTVNELKQATTEAECLRVEEPPPHLEKARKETVNGVSFAVLETGGVMTGHMMDGYVYRNFHRGKCYELDIRIASQTLDPGAMKTFDSNAVHHRLKQVLDTFEFVH